MATEVVESNVTTNGSISAGPLATGIDLIAETNSMTLLNS